ncbi:hypothetical protein HRJ34_15555 [Rhizorhabdus wittichii]|uniref:Uncharacterized protein n=1 Tax=Rhizorhabdus wittichii TaxID=160791 RepID=A0A975D131_9SPHN|nr:hypothetical protein [Rhizorhabdus wittichii]QTH19780.1 hypothetical protein HRJ34_15555 [Rhizorhabdus wittichii]
MVNKQPYRVEFEELVSTSVSPRLDLSAAHNVAKGLRTKLDRAALLVLASGRDWAEGPVSFHGPETGKPLFEPHVYTAEVKGGSVGPDWVPPHGWKVIRHADWVAAGKPGLPG